MNTPQIVRVVAASVILSVASMADQPTPFTLERLFLDSIASASASPETQASALAALESVAQGHPTGLETWLAVWPASVAAPNIAALTSPTVRAYATSRIARSPSDDALRYLGALAPPALGSDPTGELYPAAAIAYRTALLERKQGSAMQTAYLETVAQEKGKVPWSMSVRSWAVDQLCDRGSARSLPVIEKVLREIWGDQTGAQRDFCEARIRCGRGERGPCIRAGSSAGSYTERGRAPDDLGARAAHRDAY
jgi:hypothetical protein